MFSLLQKAIHSGAHLLKHFIKGVINVKTINQEHTLYKQEFGTALANAQRRDRFLRGNVGYNKHYISVASQYMIEELQPIVKKYTVDSDFNQYQGKFNFHGITPIWVFWWQGYEKMPPIVKCCFNKTKEVFSDNNYEVILLTEDNYQTYLDLPDYIVSKFESKCISIQAFSDIMRWGLMANYGGAWFDATVFLTYNSPKDIAQALKMPFYTQRFASAAECPDEPCRGKWCNFYFMGKHTLDVRIFQFVYDSILYYWAHHSTAFHYVWLDYILWTGYTQVSDIRDLIDSVPANNKNFFKMDLNKTYSVEIMEQLCQENSFYKLTYKAVFKTQDEKGAPTIYAFLTRNYT